MVVALLGGLWLTGAIRGLVGTLVLFVRPAGQPIIMIPLGEQGKPGWTARIVVWSFSPFRMPT